MLLGMTVVQAGTLNGMDDPDRVPGSFIVVLKIDHIVSLKNSVLSNAQETAVKSEKWRVAIAAADREISQIVNRLVQAHPLIQVSAVLSTGQSPGFAMKASDADAKAISDDVDVKEVDADVLLKDVTSRTKPGPEAVRFAAR